MPLRSFFSTIAAAAAPVLKRAGGSRWVRRGGRVLTLAAVIFIFAKLYVQGWQDVLNALPTHPGYYFLLAVGYAILPMTELILYRGVWNVPVRTAPVFFRKRVCNDLLDYSGEAYFYAWIKRRMPQIANPLRGIRDINLLSGAVSNAATLVLAATVGASLWSNEQTHVPLIGTAAFALVFIAGVGIFARYYFSFAAGEILRVTSLHTMRMVATLGLQALAWSFAIPSVPLDGWLLVLAAHMLVTRIPFLPQRDLMTAGVALSLAPQLSAPEVQVSALFIATAALTFIFHGFALAVTSLRITARLAEPEVARHAQ